MTPLAARRALAEQEFTVSCQRYFGTWYPKGPTEPFVTKVMSDDGELTDVSWTFDETPCCMVEFDQTPCNMCSNAPSDAPSCDDKTLSVQRSMVEYPCALAGSPPERRPSGLIALHPLTCSSRLPPPPTFLTRGSLSPQVQSDAR